MAKAWLSLVLIGACAGDPAGPGEFERPDAAAGSSNEPDAGPACESAAALFARTVQPALSICRTCHVAGGVAALHEPVPARFLLAEPADDFAQLKAAWLA